MNTNKERLRKMLDRPRLLADLAQQGQEEHGWTIDQLHAASRNLPIRKINTGIRRYNLWVLE